MHKHSKALRDYRLCLPGLVGDLYQHKDWRDLVELHYFELDFIVREKHHGNRLWPYWKVIDFVKLLLRDYAFLYDPTKLDLKSFHHLLENEHYLNMPYDALLTFAGAVFVRKIRKFLRGAILACKGYYDTVRSP